jgi:hypothetical protein
MPKTLRCLIVGESPGDVTSQYFYEPPADPTNDRALVARRSVLGRHLYHRVGGPKDAPCGLDHDRSRGVTLLGVRTAAASCHCECVNGEVVPLCSSSIDLEPICPPRICPIVPPAVAPIPRPMIPPIGTTSCSPEEVFNPFTRRYEFKTVCRWGTRVAHLLCCEEFSPESLAHSISLASSSYPRGTPTA